MAKTTRSEMKAFAGKHEAETGSEIIGYSYSPTSGFLQSILAQKFLQDEVSLIQSSRVIDGLEDGNDDFYRRTTVKTVTVETQSGQTIRRSELSLARQLAQKADQEAMIRLVARNSTYTADSGKTKTGGSPLINVIPPYTKFLLESVTESRMEKAQVIETFGDFIVFFFGRRPEVYQFSGRLLNSRNHDWKNDFQELYDAFLRGTKAVEHGATVFIQYDDVMVEGFLMGSQLEYHGTSNNECPFAFSMLVIDRAPVNQLQRLQDRRLRSRFSAAEQQLVSDINALRSAPKPFAIMQKALSLGGLSTADIVLYAESTNAITASDSDPPSLSEAEQEALDIDALIAGDQ